jgi:hypothetical protein
LKPLFVLPFVVLFLLLAIWTGWIGIGWNFPVKSVRQAATLRIGSFLSAVIFLTEL